MKRKPMFCVAMLGTVLAWAVAGQAVRGVAGEDEPAKDSRLAQLYVRLLGTSG